MNDFFASIYESEPVGFYSNGFSEAVYDNFLYQKYGLILFISVLTLVVIYYKVLDKPKFAKIAIWGIILLLSVLINAVFLFNDVRSQLESLGYDFVGEYLSLAIVNSIYASFLFVLLSIAFKLSSISNSKIPF